MSELIERLSHTLHHGGRLRQAAAEYGIPLGQWLDLSTGLNPHPWPVGPLPHALWGRLPEAEDGLEAAAQSYYGASAAVLPVAGSQAALQALPWLRPPGKVGILTPTYAEHPHAWGRAGHQVVSLPASAAVEAQISELAVLVVVNPNNPTGSRIPRMQLLAWHRRLAANGGWLVVDEAFMDPTPEGSIADATHLPGLVVLRSLGKFFGLAGARVGFALLAPPLAAALGGLLGPWPVAAPSRAVALAALADRPWQATMRAQLPSASQRLHHLLADHGLAPTGGCALFQWSRHPQAATLQRALARQGILTRHYERPASLRCGLPATAADWLRLQRALAQLPTSPSSTQHSATAEE